MQEVVRIENELETALITLYFASHGDEDSDTLRQLFKQSTIFVVEQSYRTRFDAETTRRANALSEGRMSLAEFNQLVTSSTPDFDPITAMIENSWLTIVLEQSPLSQGEIEEWRRLALEDPPESLPLSAQLDGLKITLGRMAEYDRRRDKALAAQLKKLHRENPDGKILVVRGDAHQHLLPAECRKIGLRPRVIVGACSPNAQSDVMALLATERQPTRQQLNEALQERRLHIRMA